MSLLPLTRGNEKVVVGLIWKEKCVIEVICGFTETTLTKPGKQCPIDEPPANEEKGKTLASQHTPCWNAPAWASNTLPTSATSPTLWIVQSLATASFLQLLEQVVQGHGPHHLHHGAMVFPLHQTIRQLLCRWDISHGSGDKNLQSPRPYGSLGNRGSLRTWVWHLTVETWVWRCGSPKNMSAKDAQIKVLVFFPEGNTYWYTTHLPKHQLFMVESNKTWVGSALNHGDDPFPNDYSGSPIITIFHRETTIIITDSLLIMMVIRSCYYPLMIPIIPIISDQLSPVVINFRWSNFVMNYESKLMNHHYRCVKCNSVWMSHLSPLSINITIISDQH